MNFKIGNLKEDWRRLLSALEIVKSKSAEDWEPYDILNQVYTGTLGIVVSTINDTDIGVFYIKEIPWTNEKQLWIYVAYSASGIAFELYLNDFIQLAKQLNCSSIGWDSKRFGYLRSLKRLSGAKPHRIEYKLNL